MVWDNKKFNYHTAIVHQVHIENHRKWDFIVDGDGRNLSLIGVEVACTKLNIYSTKWTTSQSICRPKVIWTYSFNDNGQISREYIRSKTFIYDN